MDIAEKEFFDRPDRGGQGVILRQPEDHSVEILFHGAQVISWKTYGMENLFLRAVNEPRTPFRGGIRICFPKIPHIPDAALQHGFATRSLWDYDSNGNAYYMPLVQRYHINADFILQVKDIEPVERERWPNSFEFRLRVILGPTGKLSMISRIKNVNTDGRAFTFPFSYQNYLFVSDISNIQIEGLERRDYVDYKLNGERSRQEEHAFTFDSGVNRLYLKTPSEITLTDNLLRRTFTIEKNRNLPDTVVWNPVGDEASAALSIQEQEEQNQMVVIEAAAQQEGITLSPRQVWMAEQHLSVLEY